MGRERRDFAGLDKGSSRFAADQSRHGGVDGCHRAAALAMHDGHDDAPHAPGKIVGDPPIRRTAGKGIDIGYYERQAKRLRSQAIHAWFARLARFCRSASMKDSGHE